MSKTLKVFSGNANLPLAKEICDYLGIALSQATASTFSDGECMVRIEENVRGMDTFLIQPCAQPVNHHIMELLVMLDALKRASPCRLTAVIPYYGYARQDRKDAPRVPISAKLLADLITSAGADRVLTVDLHAGQIQGFFTVPVDHLYAMPVFLDYFRKKALPDLVIVSPDAGGVERARAFAKRLGASLAIIDKRREGPSRVDVMNIVGKVKNYNALLVDDMVDTAGTVAQSAAALKGKQAKRILASCTHAVLSGPAMERLAASPIEELIVTNTLPITGTDQTHPILTVLSVAPLLGEAIKRIHEERSLTALFV